MTTHDTPEAALAAALAVVYGDGTGPPLTDHEYGAAAILAALDGWTLVPRVATADWTGSTRKDADRLRKIEVAARDYATDKPAFDKQWHQDNCPERGDFVRWYADRQRAAERLAAKFDILRAALAPSEPERIEE